MSRKLNIITKGSFLTRASKAAYFGIAASILFFGVRFTNNFFENKSLDYNANLVRNEISSGNLDNAKVILDSLIQSGNVREFQADLFSYKISQEYETISLKNLLESGKIPEAKERLAKIKSENKLSKEGLNSLDDLVDAYSEKKLSKFLVERNASRDVFHSYLTNYSGSENSKKIANLLLSRDLDSLIDVLKSRKSLKVALGAVNLVEDDLERYSNFELFVPKSTLNLLESDEIKSGGRYWAEKSIDEISVGDKIKVFNHNPDLWIEGYFSEREISISVGLEGEVLAIKKNGVQRVLGSFPGSKISVWSEDWDGVHKSWRGYGNVGYFEPSEIKVLTAYGANERSIFLNNLNDLVQSLKRYSLGDKNEQN